MLKNFVSKFLLFFVIFVSLTLNVYGQDCDSLVVDGAEVFKDGFNLVEDIAQKLVNSGVDVRIRTITTFGRAGNLDQYELQLERSCNSWQDGNGRRKNNLLVLIVSVRDRKTGLYYGEQWANALKDDWLRIQADHMNPQFKRGDFAGGFTAGINEINRLVNLHLHPAPVEPASPPLVIVQPPVQPSEPVDLSGLWRVMGWFFGLAVLSALGFLFWQLKLRSEKRRASQQKAVVRKQAAATRVNELNASITVLETEIEGLRKGISAADLESLHQSLNKTKELTDSGTLKYADADKSAGDPSRPKLSETEYKAIEQSYDEVIESLNVADKSLKNTQASLKNIERLIVEAPEKHAGISARVENVRQVVAGGKEVFDRLNENFVASSWKSVKGNGTAALSQIDQSVLALGEAAINIKNHEWEKTEVSFKIANDGLDKAESLIRSIIAIEKSLQATRDDAPNEIKAARADINNARDYIKKYDEDIRDSLETDLQTAEEVLADAVMEMKDSRPDYFEVSKHIKKAHESADKILVEARSEHETAERLRQKAASTLKTAKSRVSKAKEYIEDHSSDVDSDAENKLKEARRLLREAESASDLNMIIILAGQADDFGKSAYKLAEDDVSSAYVPPPVYNSPSTGGGSTDWGFSGSGGGGSSSFSSGGSGGGGSSSW